MVSETKIYQPSITKSVYLCEHFIKLMMRGTVVFRKQLCLIKPNYGGEVTTVTIQLKHSS